MTDYSEAFFTHMMVTALWSSTDDSDTPLDAEHDIDDVHPDTLARLRSEAVAFYQANREHIHCVDAPLARDMDGSSYKREAAMAGHDYWLTRCGHGAGFWDGDWPEPAATVLDNASKASGNVDLYVGDDGMIHA
jgi:hypothetical protein